MSPVPARHAGMAVRQTDRPGFAAALASLKSAALNVYVNAGALKDRAHAEAQVAELEALLANGEARAAAVYAAVRARL